MIGHLVRTSAYLLAICAMTTPLLAQVGTLRGTVADSSGAPLANASISVDGTGLKTTSGNQGEYTIRGVPAGNRVVRARLIGFQAASAPVTLGETDETRQDFTLVRSTVQLAPIDVVIGSRGRHTAS
ncbi:MAG TPA: carboxypeptidase-like regulatory domain-containing protein, partial [Gemmatimonadales bacterium]|nr:carboxypeptidase-like regulatory domain-containing protein [Gemmatimonadales bacterium]